MKAKLRGSEIYFDVAGMQLRPIGQDFEEKPVIFMLHGGPGGDHLRFKQHSLELQSVAQLIFIDHRGCGRSKKTKASEYTLENNIEDIEALRKHLGLDHITVLGTSYGGIVAQGYAIRYPKHLDKLILVATSPSFRFLDEAKEILRARGTKQQFSQTNKLWEGKFKSHQDILLFFKKMETLYSVKEKSNRKKIIPKIKTIWSHEAINNAFSSFLRTFNFIPQLKKIKCQTLILAGDKDWICPISQSKIIAKEIPHATLKIFKNCSHAIAVDAHEKYIKAITAFMK